MNSAVTVPVLYETEYLYFGDSRRLAEMAAGRAAQGERVVLASSGTFFGKDTADTLDFPDGKTPDEYKKGVERMCIEKGVKLLYGVFFIEELEQGGKTIVLFGGKFGVACVICSFFLREKKRFSQTEYRGYLVSRKNPFDYAYVKCTLDENWSCKSQDERLVRWREALVRKFADNEVVKRSCKLGRFAADGCAAKKAPEAGGEGSEETESGSCRKFTIFSDIDEFREKRYRTVSHSGRFSMKTEQAELVVAGGGTAGAMAAYTAAVHGMKTVLVEPNLALGGTGTAGGVSAYWFGKQFRDTRAFEENIKRVHERCGDEDTAGIWSDTDYWNPDLKATVLMRMCLDAGVKMLFGQTVFGVSMEDGRVTGVATAGAHGNILISAGQVIDATGDGDLAVFAGAESEYGNERDYMTLWASLAQYSDPVGYRNNFSAMMIVSDPIDYTRFVVEARTFGANTFDHGSYPCVRESRHIRGMKKIDLRTLMTGEVCEDAFYTCWSNFDPKGKVTADIVYFGVLPQQGDVSVPFACMLPVKRDGTRIKGLYVAGKAISASHNVFPSIRMQRDLLHQGSLLGYYIAACFQLGEEPEALSAERRRALLEQVTDDNVWRHIGAENTYWRAREQKEQPEAELSRLFDEINFAGVRTHWIDAAFTYTEQEGQPFLRMMCMEADGAVEKLEQTLAKERSPELRQFLIKCELWHGCDRHVEEFAEHISEKLEGGALPLRQQAITCAQLLPDHGVMPEVVYELNALSASRNPVCEKPFAAVLKGLKKIKRDYMDIRKGIFHYMESFAYVAERNGNEMILDCIEELRGFEELTEARRGHRDDILTERHLILEFELCRALAVNGRTAGYEGLADLLGSPSLVIAGSAWKTLTGLSGGRDMGYDTESWKEWIRSDSFKPVRQLVRGRQF